MKLKSGRHYKHNISDIFGILMESDKQGKRLTVDDIKNAYNELYGDFDGLDNPLKRLLINAIEEGTYKQIYELSKTREKRNLEVLKGFDTKYPGALEINNIDEVLNRNLNKDSNESILEQLRNTRKDEND